MTHIKITKGLDIPIKGKPLGQIQELHSGLPKHLALNLEPFETIPFKLLVKPGDVVKIGQPLVEDKTTPGRMFASPAAGIVTDVKRGLKRRLLDIVISCGEEYYQEFGSFDVQKASYEQLTTHMLTGGMFAHIQKRPFNLLADPRIPPRSIFVKALESAPFVPPAELQVTGHEKEFALGLLALSKLTKGPVHLVYRNESSFEPFTKAQHVQKHTAEGPHPIANQSIHIQELDPIHTVDDNVWTLNAHDVVVLGYFLENGRYYTDKIIGIGGPGIVSHRTGYFKIKAGYPIDLLATDRIESEPVRLISGDPLSGKKVEMEDFLQFNDFAFSAIPENTERKFLNFMRLGLGQYSFSKTFPSGHLNNKDREYEMTTSLHGEERAFIDGSLYDKVMPLNVPTMLLVKAVMAEDYDRAYELGLLEVIAEDFALPAFVCPSKVEMTDIIKRGLRNYASQMFE